MWTYITSWFTPTCLFLFLNLVVGTIFIISRFSSDRRPPQHHDHLSTGHPPPPLARAPSLLERVRSIDFSAFVSQQPEPQDQTHYTQHDHVPRYEEKSGPNPLARAPSLLERVKSINLPSFYSPDPNYPEPEFNPQTDSDPAPLSQATFLLERVKSINLYSFYRPDRRNQEPEFTPETDIDDHLIPDPSPHKDNDNDSHHVDRSKLERRVAAKPSGKAEKMKKSASEKSNMALLDDEQEDRESIEKRRPATVKVEKTASFGDKEVDAKADDFITKFKQQLRLQRLDSLLRHKEALMRK